MKVLSLFSGIGAFEKALDRLEIPYELVNFCEFDKYAIKSYCAIHGVDESKNLGDITKVDEKALPKDIDLITYGFPCQDISLAGKQKGLFNEDGTQTRSGLFFEALRIIEATQPRVAIAENVKNLTSKKFSEQFEIVLNSLEAAGYNNYWKVLNAKDYGIPQNRERVFIVSIRKDIDNGSFEFPEAFPLETKLKDLLEDEVDDSFYLKETKDFFIRNSFKQEANGNGFRFSPHVKDNANIAKTITTHAGGRMDDNFVIDINTEEALFKFDSKNPLLVMDEDGTVYVKEAVKKGYSEAKDGDSINLEFPNSMTRRGRVGKQVAQTLTTSPQQAVVVVPDIRKLTQKECFRVMDFDDEDYEKCCSVNTGTQLYKQAGNSIVVACPYYIFRALFDANILIDKEKEMELKVNTPTFPEVIEFNFLELKQEITERASAYVNLVYTEDQIQDAKKDRAALNKFVKALSDERIKVKKECMKPYEDFEAKIKELDGIVSKAIRNIDDQLKSYEEHEKAEKLEKIKELWESIEHPAEMKFEHVFKEKFLNKSCSIGTITQYFKDDVDRFKRDMATLQNLPEFSFEAVEVYKQTLDINKAISEGKRLAEIQKRKEEQARLAAEREAELEKQKAEADFAKCMNPPEPPEEQHMIPPAEEKPTEPLKMWVSFKALMTTEDGFALKDFFNSRGIEFESI